MENEFTADQKLQLCNMTSQGISLAEAKRRILESAKPAISAASEAGKPSARDRKAALTAEIESLGGEVPPVSASVAKFEEALTAAKARGEETDLM